MKLGQKEDVMRLRFKCDFAEEQHEYVRDCARKVWRSGLMLWVFRALFLVSFLGPYEFQFIALLVLIWAASDHHYKRKELRRAKDIVGGGMEQ